MFALALFRMKLAINALLVMMVTSGFASASSAAKRAQQLPFSIITVSPGLTSPAAAFAIFLFSS